MNLQSETTPPQSKSCVGLPVQWAGRNFRLLAPGGVYWETQNLLMVADTHFGKEATFRSASIPVPRGSTRETIRRTSKLIDQVQPATVVVLGDLFHHRTSLSDETIQALDECFVRHAVTRWVLVRGNHDRGLGKLPAHWPLEDAGEAWDLNGVRMQHHPADPPGDAELLFCGHLHPAVRLNSRSASLGKLPCFWKSKQTIVLPAIGDFTGTAKIRPGKQDQVYVVADDEVFHLP
ncbi:MAG: ligase-associated DNA damage response endonuclease PdeM [Planctomycetota bacterium]